MNHQNYRGNAIIIDDQDHVIKPLERFLQSIGFQKVFTTNSGEEGFNTIQKEAEQIRIVFLDMLMPGWSGAATLQAIKSTHPGLPVIVMSGYLENQVETYFKTEHKPDFFLQKPFDVEAVHTCLERVLQTQVNT